MVEYVHGKRVTPDVWELSPLDQSIYEYERKCKQYHYKTLKKPGETPEQRSLRLNELSKAKDHLDSEEHRLLSMIAVDSRLQAYRDEHRDLKRKERLQKYKEEEHHPTDMLEQNMRLAGRAQPGPRFTAHHLVEGKGKLPITNEARLKLFRNNIRINDSDNGVWMPMTDKEKGHWAMPHATPHSRIHTHNYERWIYGQLQPLQTEVEIRVKLGVLRAHLKNGTQPKQVTAPPNKEWNGRNGV